MCGILGYCGKFDEETLLAGSRCQAHRGPDDCGQFVEPGIGLAHLRLSIQDLSPLGHQPMLSDDDNLVLIFNGEIYNFPELRAELIGKGHHFRGHSDTEVLLKLYQLHGEAVLPRLNGIFAFAVWDRTTNSLFIARDALGVKPVYYLETGEGFAFASEIKALRQLAPYEVELDALALHQYLSFLWSPGERTPLRAVKKMLPGEMMTIRNGRIVAKSVWYQLPLFRHVHADLDEDAAIIQTAQQLRAAVHRQLIADVPVGAFLSGGLDSSAVVAFAREAAPDIRCFTIESIGGSDEGTTDDLPYARRVAKYLGVELDVVSVDAASMAADLQSMIVQLDEPLADPAPLNVLYISRLAREHGIKVLLSGAGGDDLFSGYRRHAAVAHEHIWTWLPQPVRLALERRTRRLDQRRPLWRKAAKLFDGAGLSGDERLANYFLWSRKSELMALYSPGLRQQLADAEATSPMTEFLRPLPASVAPLDRLLALEQRFFLADHNLVYTDKMSMAASVEVRVPFLDNELVEFAARVPRSLKQRGREGKWVLKKALEPYLPNDVIYRPKSGFGAPLRRWMRNELRPLLRDLLSVESVTRRGLFEPNAVQQLIARNHDGRIDAAYTLLSLLSIEIWCRAYIDGGVPAEKV